MRYPINSNLMCVMHEKKEERKEDPHCHVIRADDKIEVAKVWLSPVIKIEAGHSLDPRDMESVIKFCDRNQFSLLNEYNSNLNIK